MISLMRKSLQSNAYRVFLWMFMIFMIIGGFAAIDFSGDKNFAVKAYKQTISKLEWQRLMVNAQRQIDYFKQRGVNWEKDESVEKEVLRQSMDNLLLKHGAFELGLALPEDVLQEHLEMNLRGLPAHFFRENGDLDVDFFERAIAPQKFEDFVNDVESSAKSDLLMKLIALSSYVSDFELKMQYNEDFANKEYSILTFSLHKNLAEVKKDKVSDKVLQSFYKKSEHGDKYKTQEKRAGTYWVFSESDYGVKPSEKEINEYYDKNKKTEFLANPAQVQVKVITFAVDEDKKQDAKKLAMTTSEELEKNPEDFAAVAKKLAAGNSKQVTTTTTEFFDRQSKKYDSLFTETAFEKLSKDGQVSSVIKTKDGYQILQRVKRKSATYKDLKDVTAQISEKLATEKFKKRFQQDAHRVASQARYNEKAVADFVAKRGGKKNSIALDTRKASLVSGNLFRTDKKKFDIFMDGKNGVLLECTEIEKSKLKPFEDVKDEVASHYYREKAIERMEQQAQSALKESANADFAKLADKFGATLSKASFSYEDGQINQDAVLQRYDVAQKIRMLQSPQEAIDINSSTESLLIRLDSIAPINKELFEDKRENMLNVLQHKNNFQAKDSFIASLYRHAKLNNKIEIDQELQKKVETR